MKNKKTDKPKSMFDKMLENQTSLNECIRKGGNVHQLAKELNVKLATPIRTTPRTRE